MTTPLGQLELVAQAGELVAIRMLPEPGVDRHTAEDGRSPLVDRAVIADQRPAADRAAEGASAEILMTAQRQLDGYFAGESDSFALPTRGNGTEFQLAVWDALREVGYGETTTYGELAARIGRPYAARAVGQALARNPLPIVVPCHRVVGRHGALTGFGGGIDRKRRLLELERR
jgi:methylated-DNA-[protein]-cysteine S-methyltransferase